LKGKKVNASARTKEDVETAVRCVYGDNACITFKRMAGCWEVKLEDTDTVQYAKLLQLGQLLETDNIDVNSWKEDRGYCETCSYTATGISLQIYD
jgi:hypothetical protein